MSEHKLAGTIQVTVQVAKDIIDKFFSVVPKVENFLDKIAAVGKKYGRIRAPEPYRRIRFFPEHKKAVEEHDYKVLASIGRKSKNHPMQSCNANVTKLALCNIQDRIDAEELDMYILLAVHDAIVVEAHKSIQEYAIKIIQEEMIIAAETTIKSIPVKVDTVVGDCWLH